MAKAFKSGPMIGCHPVLTQGFSLPLRPNGLAQRLVTLLWKIVENETWP